ncbi:MAG: Anaerobic nitric oxide reductase transcription regulator NorR [Anaerolineae bacterium]|nr:Anaerobic nitric oxide reductase transcription regulator NorR [Anaerolineae bacterium]
MSQDLHLLLITRDDALAAALRAQLERAPAVSFYVTHALDVASGLAQWTAHKADAVLLDLDLQETHKLDVLITLSVQAAPVPVVAFARDDDAALGLAAVRAGAQNFLTRAQLDAPDVARQILYAIERQALSSQAHLHAEQLQFSEARFRLLINENADGILVVNEAGLIRFANRAAESLFGVSRQELIGASFLAPLRQPNMAIVEIARGAEKIFAQQRVVETVWNRENVRIVTLRDMTAERQAQEQLNAALLTQEHHRRIAQALADSAATLNSTLSYEQVLDRILENVGRVVPHDAASVFLLEGDIVRFVRGRGFDQRGLANWIAQLHFPISKLKHLEEMRAQQRAVLIPLTRADARWERMESEWIESYVGAPLCVRDEVIGFLNVDSATPQFFNATHANDLQAFADQAATALENARLHAQVAQRAERLAAMYELTRELAMQREPDVILEILVERAMQILDAPAGDLSLFVPETNELATRIVKGPLPLAVGSSIAAGQGLVGRAALLREPVMVDDYAAWEFRLEASVSAHVSAALSVPMLYGGELVGVLSVREIGASRRRYVADEAQLLMMLATQAAALVHNARLHQETAKRAQQLALVYDAGLTLNRELEPRVQLDFLTRIAMRSVRAEHAAFFRYDALTQELVLDFALGYENEKDAYIYLTRVPLQAAVGIEAWVAREHLPAHLPDTARDERFARSSEFMGSGIWVPVEHDAELLGVLGVGSSKPHAFSHDDERLLLLFASQAAVALENARLYQSVLQENERRNILHWASQEVLSAGLDAERVYVAIHQAISRLMSCEAFALALWDEQTEMIQLPYMVDRAGRQPVTALAKSQGLSGKIIDTGEPLNIGHLARSGVPSVNFGYPIQVVSVLGVPLRHGGKIIGALLVESYEENAYDDADRVRLEMLAAHVAASLMNVRGYETLRRASGAAATD